jgi:hypothetical protein
MFKVGDRVKRTAPIHDGSIPIGTHGTVISIDNGTKYPRVRFDSGVEWGCDYTTVSLTHTWQVGDEFEVDMEGGGTDRGKLVSLSPFRAVTDTGALWSWNSFEDFCSLARPILATHTYQPGDKVIATEDFEGSAETGPIKKGTVGEVLPETSFITTFPGAVGFKFNRGRVQTINLTWVAPYLQPADSPPLSCIRCEDFFPMAEPNLPDGKLACGQCRKYHLYAVNAILRKLNLAPLTSK